MYMSIRMYMCCMYSNPCVYAVCNPCTCAVCKVRTVYSTCKWDRMVRTLVQYVLWCHISFIDDNEKSGYKIFNHIDDKYKIVKSSNAYNFGLARIKPFLTAFGRLKIMKFIHNCNIEKSIVRIHTDGLAFNKPIDFEKYNLDYYPMPEDKTTGKSIIIMLYMVFMLVLYAFLNLDIKIIWII